MTEPKATTIQIDEFIHLRLWHLIFFRSIPRCVAWYGVVMALVVLVIYDQDGWSIDLVYCLLAGLIAFLAMLVIQWMLLPGRSGKVFKETAQMAVPKLLSLDSDGFEYTWDQGRLRSNWFDLVKWDENSDLIALFPNRLSAYPLPKAQLGAELEAYIRDQLRDAGLPARGKPRK